MALSALIAVLLVRSGNSLTFVRHGETVANATGKYNGQTLNTLSEKGEKQVVELTKHLLAEPRFDLILVSPSPRVLQTIAPYLRATHQRAKIWPLLYECCTGRRPKDAHPTKFAYGSRIIIPREFLGLFIVEMNHGEFPVASTYDQGLAQVDASIAEYRRRFATGRVLLVGHSGQGGHFIHELTGKWIKLDNAKEVAVQ